MVDRKKLIFRRGLYSIWMIVTTIGVVQTASYSVVVCGETVKECDHYAEARRFCNEDNYGYDVLDGLGVQG
jgi:hypothetical protein